MASPLLIIGESVGAGLLKEAFFPNKIKEIQQEVLEEMRGNIRRLNRVAREDLTTQQRQDIARNAAQTVGPSLAARGISRSPAAGGALASAAAAGETALRQQAQAQLLGAQGQLFAATQTLIQDDSFFDDLGAIAQNLTFLEGLGAIADPLIRDTVKLLADDRPVRTGRLPASGGFSAGGAPIEASVPGGSMVG